MVSILEKIEEEDILYYSSASSQEYERGANTNTLSNTCIAETRTSELCEQEGQEEAQKANKSQNGTIDVRNSFANAIELSELLPLIRDIFFAAKGAGLRIDNNKEQLAEATAVKIKQQHPEWSNYDVLGFYKKLEEDDTEIQGLIADVMGN